MLGLLLREPRSPGTSQRPVRRRVAWASCCVVLEHQASDGNSEQGFLPFPLIIGELMADCLPARVRPLEELLARGRRPGKPASGRPASPAERRRWPRVDGPAAPE